MEELITYQTFGTEDTAAIVAEKLQQEGIETEVVRKVRRLDGNFIGDDHTDNYELKIAPSAFNKANTLLYNNASVTVDSIDAGHPMLMLSIEELKDVARKPYEWGADNYNIALALLKSKDIDTSTGSLANLQEEQIEILSRRKKANPYFLALGYTAALIPFLLNYISYQTIHNDSLLADFRWYFPGFIGPLVGWSILVAKTTLPDGRRITPYTARTIKHAMLIFALNIFSWLLNIVVMLLIMK